MRSWIVAGFVEREGDWYDNTLALFSPTGQTGDSPAAGERNARGQSPAVWQDNARPNEQDGRCLVHIH